MPDLNSIIRWLKRVRTNERRKAAKYVHRELFQSRADMLSDLIEWDIHDWAKKNTEPGDMGPRCDKQGWKP